MKLSTEDAGDRAYDLCLKRRYIDTRGLVKVNSTKEISDLQPFSFPEAELLLVSTKQNHDFWRDPIF